MKGSTTMIEKASYTAPFEKINSTNIAQVGGKNASLGEMVQNLASKGIQVPKGFAVTAQAYWDFIDYNNLRETLGVLLDKVNESNLQEIGEKARGLLLQAILPEALITAIKEACRMLSVDAKSPLAVAVRSSATAEGLPNASFTNGSGQLFC